MVDTKLQEQFERVASSIALAVHDDLPALAALHEQINATAQTAVSSDNTELRDLLSQAGSLVEQIIMREVDDEAAAYEQARDLITQADASIRNAGTRASSESSGAWSDADMVRDWTESTREHLREIETSILAAESDPTETDNIEDVKRRLHTLKGECGVLSLELAQELLHNVETELIGAPASDEAFKQRVETVLAMLDWMTAYVTALEASASAAPPPLPAGLARLGEGTLSESTADATADANEQPNPPQPDPVAAEPTTDAVSDAQQALERTGEALAGLKEAVKEPDADTAGSPAATETLEASFEPEARSADDDDPVSFDLDADSEGTLGEFMVEAREHLTSAEEAMLSLEHDAGNLELVNTVFRAFHTIKGVAGFLGLEPIVRLAHHAETMLDLARNHKLTLDSGRVDLILASCDMLNELLGALEGEQAPTRGAHAELIQSIEDACDPSAEVSAPSRPAPTEPDAPGSPAEPADTQPATPSTTQETPARQTKSVTAAQTVKVSTPRMDHLLDLVGELVIAHQMVVQDDRIQQIKSQKTTRNLMQSGKIVRDLQEVAMSLRMVTIRGAFQKMSRLVRDISAKSGKQIDLRMEGEDTELDRTVVDEIADPLVHMIRNACDHGLEPADERIAAGKPARGTLNLRAYHQGGAIVIEVADDGRGLKRERILKKAIEKGLIPADRNPDDIPDAEVFNMIFAPGFSTADKVTDISGRGVGMDVVRRNIEALRGKCEIKSKPGKGTTFRMSLPLTMAIIDGMIVRVGTQRYVIPTLSIEQSYRPTQDQLHTVAGRGEMASVRGSLLPIYRLNRIFNLDEGLEDVSEALLIVLESHDSRCCLLVDEILGQQQVVIKSLGQGLGSIRGVSGGAILGDGRVALIVDVSGLVAQAVQSAPEPVAT
ncbi:MAG: chemotaxis protein CheW [Phycisphaerales bacterium]